VKRSRPFTTPEKDTANTTAEPLSPLVSLHTLEGRILFVKSPEGDDITYVDSRWSSRSKIARAFHLARKRRNTV
jgi:hypothetical protein